MVEGKLTLPVIYALNSTQNAEMMKLAFKVKEGDVSAEEISKLVRFAINNGGIEYAENRMKQFHDECLGFIDNYIADADIKESLKAYLDFVIERKL